MVKPFVGVQGQFENGIPGRKGEVQVGGRPPAVVSFAIGQSCRAVERSEVVLEKAGYAEFRFLRGGLETGIRNLVVIKIQGCPGMEAEQVIRLDVRSGRLGVVGIDGEGAQRGFLGAQGLRYRIAVIIFPADFLV